MLTDLIKLWGKTQSHSYEDTKPGPENQSKKQVAWKANNVLCSSGERRVWLLLDVLLEFLWATQRRASEPVPLSLGQ